MDALAHIGGAYCLDLVATVRRRFVEPCELLNTPADLVNWFESAGLWTAEMQRHSGCSVEDLASARRLREAIYEVLRARLASQPPDQAYLDQINYFAAQPCLAPQLWISDSVVRTAHEFLEGGNSPASMTLSAVAREAVEILGTQRFASIKRCAQDTCSLFFVDDSQGKRRRWCSMGRCGNLAKLAKFRGKGSSEPRDR